MLMSERYGTWGPQLGSCLRTGIEAYPFFISCFFRTLPVLNYFFELPFPVPMLFSGFHYPIFYSSAYHQWYDDDDFSPFCRVLF